MSQMSKFVPAVAVAVLLSAAVTSASHSWGPYHWARTSNPFTLQLGNNLTRADWKAHLATTSQDWNSGSQDWNSGKTPLLTAIVAGSSRKRCSMVAGTTQVCNGTYGFNGWLGLASINIVNGEHITQGSAKVNDSYFDTAKYNNPNEKLHVMCQEVAHTFGLGHTSENGTSQNTCMDYFSNTGANAESTLSTKPNAHDFEQLTKIYSQFDNTTTVAAGASSPAAAASEVNDDPNSWGQLMSQGNKGRSSTYEKVERDGSKTVTHVFWTAEAAARCPGCDHRFDR